jgi:hypothetical protein
VPGARVAVPFQPRQLFLFTAPLLPFAVEQRGALAQHQGVRPSDPSCPVIHRTLGSVDAAMHVGPTVLASGHSNLVWAGFPRKPRSSVHKLATTAFRELDRPVVAGARRPGKARLENRRAVGRDGVEAGRAPVRRRSRAQGAMAQPTRSTSQNRTPTAASRRSVASASDVPRRDRPDLVAAVAVEGHERHGILRPPKRRGLAAMRTSSAPPETPTAGPPRASRPSRRPSRSPGARQRTAQAHTPASRAWRRCADPKADAERRQPRASVAGVAASSSGGL